MLLLCVGGWQTGPIAANMELFRLASAMQHKQIAGGSHPCGLKGSVGCRHHDNPLTSTLLLRMKWL
jgi:hypothetical protein